MPMKLEFSNDNDRKSVSDSDHGSEEWELNLHVLEALEISDETPHTTLSEDEPDCAWEFDASALECLETSTFDDLGLDEYRPAYSDYSFKDEAAESLLLSLLQRKLLRLSQPHKLEEMWKMKKTRLLCIPQDAEPPYCWL